MNYETDIMPRLRAGFGHSVGQAYPAGQISLPGVHRPKKKEKKVDFGRRKRRIKRGKTWMAPHGFWKPDGKERTISNLRVARDWLLLHWRSALITGLTAGAPIVLTVLLVKQAYLTRGEFAIGGEWLVLPAAGLYALIRWVDKKDREENHE